MYISLSPGKIGALNQVDHEQSLDIIAGEYRKKMFKLKNLVLLVLFYTSNRNMCLPTKGVGFELSMSEIGYRLLIFVLDIMHSTEATTLHMKRQKCTFLAFDF